MVCKSCIKTVVHNVSTYWSSLMITVEFLDNWFLTMVYIKQANKLQKPTTRLQIDLHCLAVHKNTNKRTLEYP